MPDWLINRALESYRSLGEVIAQLTAEQIEQCLRLEKQTRRRKSVITRLTKQAVSLNKQQFISTLENTHGTSTQHHPQQS